MPRRVAAEVSATGERNRCGTRRRRRCAVDAGV